MVAFLLHKFLHHRQHSSITYHIKHSSYIFKYIHTSFHYMFFFLRRNFENTFKKIKNIFLHCKILILIISTKKMKMKNNKKTKCCHMLSQLFL